MNLRALLPWHGRRLWLGGLSMEGAGLMTELMPEGGPGPCPQPPGLPVPHHHSAADPGSPLLQPYRCPGWCLMGQLTCWDSVPAPLCGQSCSGRSLLMGPGPMAGILITPCHQIGSEKLRNTDPSLP